ncbi:MAG: Dam family site-specific DNA-(adenine-N6)-methyltransferase [Proteobacteria bacterium]|nr:Dam family site-specific DNA-(adenine-N6)-methyltransferase [Pseudomonadota bacterium]
MAIRRASKRVTPLPQVGRDPIATPIIKWVGGKTKLLPELLARLPDSFERYYEPFIGGAALFFRVAPERAVLNDSNTDLVNLYATVTKDAASVIKRLAEHRANHDERHYYAMRQKWNDDHRDWPAADRAAAFIYLNKTCFNGLWRVNRSGDFNVPIGRYADPPICVPEALQAASRALAKAELRQGDYRAAVADAKRGDFLYFDPPYDPVTPTANFTSYTAGAFGPEQQRELADAATSTR